MPRNTIDSFHYIYVPLQHFLAISTLIRTLDNFDSNHTTNEHVFNLLIHTEYPQMLETTALQPPPYEFAQLPRTDRELCRPRTDGSAAPEAPIKVFRSHLILALPSA